MEDIIYLTEDFEPVEENDPRMTMVKVRMPDGKIVFGRPVPTEVIAPTAQNELFVQGNRKDKEPND